MQIKDNTDIDKLDFAKGENGLLPAIIQNPDNGEVLMLGYVNAESLKKTLTDKKVCFFSRSKNRLWTKGEESGNFLELKSVHGDCDSDSLLILAYPKGPTCHKGTSNCFDKDSPAKINFLGELAAEIEDRKLNPRDGSYTASLFAKGINKVAQKVGEEAVELVIEAKDENKDLFLNEAADLMYHYLVLLTAKNYSLTEVVEVLKSRVK